MSISPTIAIAALPAVRLASESVKGALSAGVHFAKQLADASKSDAPATDGKPTNANETAGFDQLLPQFQQFLESIGARSPSTVELQTDGQGPLEVDAEPAVKQAVEQWLSENPEWREAWQAAASDFLLESRSLSSSFFHRPSDTPFAPRVRSAVSTKSAEHWIQTKKVFENYNRAR